MMKHIDTKQREKAALLVAEDTLTDEKIAEACGISRPTLSRWKNQETFKAKVEKATAAYAERALKHGLAKKEKRITILNDIHGKLQQVIDERAVSEELAEIPGGKTGLVTKTLKGIGKGDDFQIVEVYEVDTATIREIRAIHQQVAEELGQHIERHEHSGKEGGPIVFKLERIGARVEQTTQAPA